jgi:GNAT superfamily N-acetyltransferase
MADQVVRPGVEDDAPAMLEILEAALSAEERTGGIAHVFPDRAREVAWLQHLTRDPEGSAFVVEVDRRPAAFGITARRGEILWLAYLFVLPEHQGRGLGRALLGRLWPEDSGARATLVDATSRVAMGLYLHHSLIPRGWVLSLHGALPCSCGASTSIQALDDWSVAQPRVGEIDQHVSGASRGQDHKLWAAQGYAFRSLRRVSGEWLGYARWSPSGRLGPVAVAQEDAWPEALGVILGEMRAAGIDSARMMIPGINVQALRWSLLQGFEYRGMEVALATRTVGDWSRYLIHRAALP